MPRGRVRKVGWRREDAAMDAMKPLGFPLELVKRKLKELLNTYGDDGWIFIEEASYKLLIEVILEEIQNEEQGESTTKLITNGDVAESSASAPALEDARQDAHLDVADGPNASPVNRFSAQSSDAGLNKDTGDKGETSIKHDVVLGIATPSGTGQANGILENVSLGAAGTSGVGNPDEAPDIGSGIVPMAADNVASQIETNVKTSDSQCPQSCYQPIKRTRRKRCYGLYTNSDDEDIIDATQVTYLELSSELPCGTNNAPERKKRWDLKPIAFYSRGSPYM